MLDFLNPFGPSQLGGLRVVESPDRPRYELPAEVMPGVPWPPGFREETNRWARRVLGTTNMLPRGTAYIISGNYVVMRPSDVVRINSIV